MKTITVTFALIASLATSSLSFAEELDCRDAAANLVDAIVKATPTEKAKASINEDVFVILDYGNEENTLLGYRVSKGLMHYAVELSTVDCSMIRVIGRTKGGSFPAR